MQNDFSTTTQTVEGHKVKDVKFNSIAGKWLGFVWFPGWAINEGKTEQWISATWHKTGKCVNRSHGRKFDLK